ncbi:MAG: D-alanyl-D-alanine carboxypeptidase [Gammaproteobacteria bacterium]|nr:D-alanyl-D-alanine carboxypeptidase [Gammaproteobacteria bacterium]
MIDKLVLFLCLTVGTSTTLLAATAPVPAPPQVAANAYLLVDFDSGKVLAERNIDHAIPPASITKIMTSYVVYHELAKNSFALDSLVPVSKKAWRMKGSRMFIEVGDKVSVADLLRGVVIQSGNDASVALAEYVAGSEESFAEIMNIHAQRLGMSNTVYRNSTGWPDGEHVTTARDIVTLSRALIAEFPEHYETYAEREYTFNGIVQYNRNKLLWRDDSVDGVKTGHTQEAGYCLVSSAKRGDMRLIAVVLGAQSEDARVAASRKLLGYGFRFFETHKLYSADQSLSEIRVWKGTAETLAIGLRKDLFVTIPRGQYKKLDAALQVSDAATAPARKYQSLGKVRVTLDGELVEERPLLALQDIAEGNLWQQARDTVLLLFH